MKDRAKKKSQGQTGQCGKAESGKAEKRTSKTWVAGAKRVQGSEPVSRHSVERQKVAKWTGKLGRKSRNH